MRVTGRLYQHALRLTFFTRANCSLCTDAKAVLSKVWDRRPYEYDEIDVMASKQNKWKDIYEFDTPVVRIPVILRSFYDADVARPAAY